MTHAEAACLQGFIMTAMHDGVSPREPALNDQKGVLYGPQQSAIHYRR